MFQTFPNKLIGIPKECRLEEHRVAITPDSIKRLQKLGWTVRVETQAGLNAAFTDEAFQNAGATICNADVVWTSPILLKVQKPSMAEIEKLKPNNILISFLEPHVSKQDGTLNKLNEKKITAFSVELVPRISRAQSMDALSSQANIAGYVAVLEAARYYPRFFPMLMTSAGSSKPAKVAILGAGVAGLQAIGTARRLGAQVEAYDVRPEVKEQILSLGAKFMDLGLQATVAVSGTGQGGYAKELTEEARKAQEEALSRALVKFDIIISTANIPGKKAPILIKKEVVAALKPGSVIVDLAAATGGNCELTQAGKLIDHQGVRILGHTNFPSHLASDASLFYARNLFHFVELLGNPDSTSGSQGIDLEFKDEILKSSCLTHQGRSI